jgi:hypothetical protein
MGEVYRALDERLGRQSQSSSSPRTWRVTRSSRAPRERSADAGGAQSPAHRCDLRPRGPEWLSRTGARARRGRDAGRACRGGSSAARARACDRATDRGRARGRMSAASSTAI